MNKHQPYHLPLFPLNTVLFPGMPLPLHIFEQRYKTMISDCMRDHKPFGVVLIKSGSEAGPAAEPYRVGTTARVVSLERLPEGRFNIETVGEDRFRILELQHDQPYLSAIVENFPVAGVDSPAAPPLATRLKPWLTQYMTLLARAAETPFDPVRLPNDCAALAYLAAIVLQTPASAKQSLLTLPSLTELLERERHIYRNELAILKTLLNEVPSEEQTFSAN
jgi:Lon protease-like protein